MSTKRLDLGAVSAYAMAVEQGYRGTEEEFGLILANAANYAAESKDAKTAAEAAAGESAGSAQAAEGYKTAAGKILEDVHAEGTTQIQAISTAGEEQIQVLEAKGTEQIQAIETAGAEQIEAAKAEIDEKGKQTLDSIPEDYTGLQTEVDELRGDITGLQTVVDSKADKSELAKTNLYLDALYKLNKGQTYDVLQQESEAYSVDVPSGSHYVGVDMVGGKSLVWNQLVDKSKNIKTQTISGVEFTNNDDGTITLNGTASEGILIVINQPRVLANHKHLLVGIEGGSNSTYYIQADHFSRIYSEGEISTPPSSGLISVRIGVEKDAVLSNVVFKPQLFDLTQMFGARNEPTIEEFEAMFPADYYPYCEPTIISSQTDRVDVASADGTITQQITTGFPILNSAGSVYDYIELNEGKLRQRVGAVDLGTLNWQKYTNISNNVYYAAIRDMSTSHAKALCSKFTWHNWDDVSKLGDGTFQTHPSLGIAYLDSEAHTDATAFKNAMNGVMFYYELAEEIITDIDIPTELTDWLEVEAGGSVTFHNADEGKRLLIPNKETFIRNLNEVTV